MRLNTQALEEQSLPAKARGRQTDDGKPRIQLLRARLSSLFSKLTLHGHSVNSGIQKLKL